MPYVHRTDGHIDQLFCASQDGYAEEFLADDDGEVAAYLNPAPEAPVTPVLACLANLQVADGDVQAVEAGATGLAFAFAVAPNVIWAYFTEPPPDGLYNPGVNSTSGNAKPSDRQIDHVEITVENPTEPYTLFIQIFRTT